MKISVKSLLFQLMWSVEEVHVSHLISIRRMSKRLSNQSTAKLVKRLSDRSTAKLIRNAGTACVMLGLNKIN